MSPKNNKKLETINARITELIKQKNQLQETFAQDISQEITKIVIKKNAFNIDKSILLKKINTLIDEIYQEKSTANKLGKT